MKKIEDLRLENARKLAENFQTLADFANVIDRSATQVSRIMGKNPTKAIGSRMARHIEQSLGLDEGWLDSVHVKEKLAAEQSTGPTQVGFFWDDEPKEGKSIPEVKEPLTPFLAAKPDTHKVKTYPLISKVQAGSWSEITERAVVDAPHYPCPVPCSDRTFILKVTGESMQPNYQDGYLVWVDPEVEPTNKSHVIARLDDFNEATFKQLVIEDNLKFLKPLNEDWPEQYIKINGNCTIVGVVIFGGFIP